MTTWARQIYEHDPLAIAKGESNGYSVVHKFGANFDIDNNSEPETVWTGGGLYPWSSLETAQTIYCISTSASDTGTLEIQGLDEDYNVQTETVTLTGTTAVTTTNTFLRIYRMVYTDTSDNVGTLTARVTSGTGTVVAQVDAGFNQTLMAIYTVPADYTAYILCGDFSVQKSKDSQIMLYQRPVGGIFTIAHMAEVFESTYRYDFPVPLAMPEKTDLDIRADNVESNNTRVTSNFTMILVQNSHRDV
jgi:hypothetical protein